MVDKDQIERWVGEGTITQEQAKKMIADVTKYKREKSSNKLIVAISTIGSIFLGLGAIQFIASNWTAIPNVQKVLLLVGSTFGAYFTGYYFKYQKRNLPNVGASLIFLGALLFGSTLFLIAQMYHINANNHTLVLIWILGILPLVYGFNSLPIAGLCSLLFYLWIGLFVFKGNRFGDIEEDLIFLPVLYLVSGVLLYGIGSLHYLLDKLKGVARIYRLSGLKVVMFSLFLLTFRLFSGHYDHFRLRDEVVVSGQFTILFVFFAILAMILAATSLFFNPTKAKTSNLENGIGIGIVAIALIFYFLPVTTNLYVVLFNVILVAIVFVLLFIGTHREDMKIVNTGMFWLSALVIVRYFDCFWDLLPRSLFFMAGGIVLLLGGIVLEKKRKQFKEQFSS